MLQSVFDVKTLAMTNLALQTLLFGVLLVAGYLARKRRLQVHCATLRVGVPLLALSVISMMGPAVLGYFPPGPRGLLLSVEIALHTTLGLLVVALWVYFNLVFMGTLKSWGRLAVAMRLALALWLVSFFVGLHVYVATYL